MKSGGETKRAPRIRLLSRDEITLWRLATADVMRRRKVESPVVDPPTPAIVKPVPSASKTIVVPAPVLPPAPAGEKRKPTLAPLAPIEKKLKRRLSSGRAQVDDVLDLHGLTQAQAHRALNNFIWRSAENGAKVVLVITGKGMAGDEGDYAPERGVLRRNAPHWLRAPELRQIVLSVEEAARPHGGAGALYVRLRRRFPG